MNAPLAIDANPSVPAAEAAAPRGERNLRFDNAKGFLIAMVVLGHALQKAPEMSSWHIQGRFATLYCIIYMFHMPAFTFFSGYFSSAKKGMLDHVRDVLLLYVVCQTLWCGYVFAFSFFGMRLPRVDELLYAMPGEALWYLLSLFFWRMTTPLLTRMRPSLAKIALFSLYGALLGLIAKVGGEFSLSRTITFFPFFVAGFWARSEQWQILSKSLSWKDLPLVGLAAVCAPLVFKQASDISVGLLTLESSFDPGLEWKGVGFRLMLYAVAFGAIRCLCLLIPDGSNVLTILGRNSLSIYIGHVYVLQPLKWLLPDSAWLSHMMWLTPLLTVVCCALFCVWPIGDRLRRIAVWLNERLVRTTPLATAA